VTVLAGAARAGRIRPRAAGPAGGRRMVSCHPAQPAQHVRYMGPEDTAVAVALIHDHVLQPPEEAIPPVMARQAACGAACRAW